jgi:phenylacetate-coenzyme A ligase PaaK-like adenylate-forming protein
MPETERLKQLIFSIKDDEMFEMAALEVFRFQYQNGNVYQKYCKLLGCDPSNVRSLDDIPFLPVEFFRDFMILCPEGRTADLYFRSSGTTSSEPSTHHVADAEIYLNSLHLGFSHFWGTPSDYRILALLPGYIEQGHSSLVFMMKHLMELSGDEQSGFYLDDHKQLNRVLMESLSDGRKTMLLGVSHALLDFGEQYPMNFPDLKLVETGGMKGRRVEMVRDELHARLTENYGVKRVASEYGMTELLSQAWATEDGLFRTVPWMRVLLRDPNDPFGMMPTGRSGGINVIDLANLHSCSFIATQDLGRMHPDGRFEVLGRFDHSDIRGCNLLVT